MQNHTLVQNRQPPFFLHPGKPAQTLFQQTQVPGQLSIFLWTSTATLSCSKPDSNQNITIAALHRNAVDVVNVAEGYKKRETQWRGKIHGAQPTLPTGAALNGFKTTVDPLECSLAGQFKTERTTHPGQFLFGAV